MRKRNSEQRGIVLVIVVITIAVLSTIVVDFIYSTRVSYEISVNNSRDVQARHIAKSGVRVVRSIMKRRTPEDLPVDVTALSEAASSENGADGWKLSITSFPIGAGNISLQVTDERAKINLNALVDQKSSKVDFQVRTQLNELFRFLKVEKPQADVFVASLVNWLDGRAKGARNDQESRGATAAYYSKLENPYNIKDGPLDSVEEIRMIQGMDGEFFSKVRGYLTVYPKDKQVNLSTASKEVIMATIKAAAVTVTKRENQQEIKDNVVDRMAKEILAQRRSSRVVSADDAKKVLKEAATGLNISSGIAGLVLNTGKSDVYAVLSTGIVGGEHPVTRQIRAVIRKNPRKKSSEPTILSWRER